VDSTGCILVFDFFSNIVSLPIRTFLVFFSSVDIFVVDVFSSLFDRVSLLEIFVSELGI